MSMKKKKSSKPGKVVPTKASKSKVKKERGPSRKAFIMELIKGAGRKGISKEALVAQTDKQFGYSGESSSRMRVSNTVRDALASKHIVVNEDGVITARA